MTYIHQTGFLAPQSQLQGRYIIEQTVGAGGMGSVYKAIDTLEKNRIVAIKEMGQSQYHNFAKLREAEELFQREAAMLSHLSHPHLPHVYDFFNEHGRFYLVMDFIEGKTLKQLLTESATQCLPVEDILDYALQLCDVLAYLHQQTPPIIFRDLKPSNVMVTAKGNVYLIDFGIARVFKQGLLQDTQRLGTPGFASPEQYGSGQTGPKSDLYSLGATLHYCLTGKDPRSNQPTLFHFLPAHSYNQQIPLNLSELIQRLVATREDQRPIDAKTVQNDLLYIQGRTSNTNSNITSGYDPKIACAAQLSSWMLSHTRLPGLLGVWWINMVIPLVANIYGTFCACFLLIIIPRLKQFSHAGRRVLSTSPTRIWQSFFTRQPHWLDRFVWTPYFIFLLIVFGVAMIGGSLYLIIILHYPFHIVSLYLCIFLLFLLFGAISNRRIRQPFAQHILAATILLVGVISITLFTLPEVQSLMRATTFNQLLSLCIVVLITVSLLRPKDRFGWVDHVCLAIVSATYALLLNDVGIQTLRQLLAFSKQLLAISLDNLTAPVNNFFICILLAVSLIELCRAKYTFRDIDIILLFIVTLIITPMHFFYGLHEITYLLSSISYPTHFIKTPLDLATFNIILTSIPIIASLFWIFLAPVSLYLIRLPLLPLSLACVALQSFLGPAAPLPLLNPPLYPLASSLGSIIHLDQLTAYGLILIIVVLFCRRQRPFRWFEQSSLFYVATVCALLQNAAWNTDNLFTSLPTHSQTLRRITITQPQLHLLTINKLLTQALTLLVLTTLTIAISNVFLRLGCYFTWPTRQINRIRKRFPWISQLSLRLDHILLFFMTIASIPLLWLFGDNISLLKHVLFIIPFNQQKDNLTVNQLMILLLGVSSLVALVRISRPFTGIDRWIILINALVCAMLLFSSSSPQMTIQQQSQIIGVKLWLADPQIVLPSQGIGFGLLFAVLVSFMWVKRHFPQPYHSLQIIGFGLALICTLLQWFIPFCLVAGLIIVTLSIFLTIQVEQQH